jgi:hypothetical protein
MIYNFVRKYYQEYSVQLLCYGVFGNVSAE